MDNKFVLDVHIAHGGTSLKLNEKLSDLVARGYVPIGGASISTTGDLVQTMVLYKQRTNEEA